MSKIGLKKEGANAPFSFPFLAPILGLFLFMYIVIPKGRKWLKFGRKIGVYSYFCCVCFMEVGVWAQIWLFNWFLFGCWRWLQVREKEL